MSENQYLRRSHNIIDSIRKLFLYAQAKKQNYESFWKIGVSYVRILKYSLVIRKYFFRMTMNTITNYWEGVKCKNPDKFAHIWPIPGNFHKEMSFMSAIYKRLKESNIEDLLVDAGLTAQTSVVQDGHYNQEQGYISYFMKLRFVYS